MRNRRKLALAAALISFGAALAFTTPAAASPSCHTVDCPRITAVSPSSGPATGGYTVIITGANLGDVTSVQFGAANYAPDFIATPTLIAVQVPASPQPGAVRHVHVFVTSPQGWARAGFTYTPGG